MQKYNIPICSLVISKSREYLMNRIWHKMTEYPVENGYGCYDNDRTAPELAKCNFMR